MYVHAAPSEKAKTLFNEAVFGQFRGRESFCKMLEASSILRLSTGNPYTALKITEDEFKEHLHGMYRRAARDNYEDSTNERFIGSNRPIHEALSDLHLVPVYMELGGLDPKLEESWVECGIDRTDYLAVYSARRIDEAARVWNLVKDPTRKPASNCIALENILTLLTEAGFDKTQEEPYTLIKTTKQDFDNCFAQQKYLLANPYPKLIIG